MGEKGHVLAAENLPGDCSEALKAGASALAASASADSPRDLHSALFSPEGQGTPCSCQRRGTQMCTCCQGHLRAACRGAAHRFAMAIACRRWLCAAAARLVRMYSWKDSRVPASAA